MANKPIRVEDELWERFGEACPPTAYVVGGKGGQTGGRSEILRDFMRYYVGEPGVACPRRPRASAERARVKPATTP